MRLKVLILIVCSTSYLSFQNVPSSSDDFNKSSSGFDSLLTSLALDSIPGSPTAYYSKNYELRARTLQSLLKNCCSYYEKEFHRLKFSVDLIVVGENHWNSLGTGIPYGMPASLNAEDKILMAGDKRYVGRIFGKLDTLPDNIPSEFDQVGLHELGHNFFQAINRVYTGKAWADEFLASYFAICYLNGTGSKETLPQLSATGYTPTYRSLENFEHLYFRVGPQNYAWYQMKFIDLANSLYPKFKLELINKFLETYKSPNGKPKDPMMLLNEMAPDITSEWVKKLVE